VKLLQKQGILKMQNARHIITPKCRKSSARRRTNLVEEDLAAGESDVEEKVRDMGLRAQSSVFFFFFLFSDYENRETERVYNFKGGSGWNKKRPHFLVFSLKGWENVDGERAAGES
jgi:hypothetical protein